MDKMGWFKVVIKVIENSTIRHSAYEFLFAFHCPYVGLFP